MSERRVLPADVYDALELSALAYGGIGAGVFRMNDGTPCCAYGHAGTICDNDDANIRVVVRAFTDIGLNAVVNDAAVHRVNRRAGFQYVGGRVSFAEWCAELGVVRGET